MRVLLGLYILTLLACTDAKVKFMSSELFDQYDIQGQKDVPLTKCKTGCYVYASVPKTVSGLEKNIWIVNHNTSARMMDVASLADSYEGDDPRNPKFKLTTPRGHLISIVNDNANQECSTVVIYAVSMTMFEPDVYIPPPVYDVNKVQSTYGTGNAVMLMGAEYFTIKSINFSGTPDFFASGKNLQVHVQPSGFDASIITNGDGCLPIYDTMEWNKDDVYLPILSPLATISWSDTLDFNINWMLGAADNIPIRGDVDTGVQSSGYTGCPAYRRPYLYGLGNAKTHTRFQALKPMRFDISTDLTIEKDNSIRITSDTGDILELWGSFDNTNKFQNVNVTGMNVTVDWEDKYMNSTFMLRIHVSDPTTTSPSPPSSSPISITPSTSVISVSSTPEMDISTKASATISGGTSLLLVLLTFVMSFPCALHLP